MRKTTFTITLAVGLFALTALAAGAVRVYKNDFSNRGEVREIAVAGKACKTQFRKGKDQLGVLTKRGGTRCRLRLPVQGDAPQPDHIVRVEGKLLKKTPRKQRKRVYYGIAVRAGGGGFYELRVYPQRRQYQLLRRPDGAGFPVVERDGRIGKVAERNRMTLRAVGDTVAARIGKVKVPGIVDADPGELPGTRITLVAGQHGGSSDGAKMIFQNLSVSVPNP